jgi:hypothetical protein
VLPRSALDAAHLEVQVAEHRDQLIVAQQATNA